MQDLLQEDRENVLSQTPHLWGDLRGERIFITGGTGFVGCWLLETFAWANDHLDLGASAVILTRDPAAFRKKAQHLADNPAIKLVSGDIRTFEFPAGSFRYVIHAAADANLQSGPDVPSEVLETIIDGTKRTLEFSRGHGVEKYLFTSSGAVYGTQPSDMARIPEHYSATLSSTDNRGAYGRGKLAAEKLCANEDNVACKIARCFAFGGPYLPFDGHFAFGSFVRDAVQGLSIRIKGDGTPVRTYLYAADLAVWLWTILLRGEPGRAYNVGSENEITIRQLAEEVSLLLSGGAAVHIGQEPTPGLKPARYVPCTRLAREELSLREFTDRQKSILRTAAWYREALRRGINETDQRSYALL